jgi:hypothetical protein
MQPDIGRPIVVASFSTFFWSMPLYSIEAFFFRAVPAEEMPFVDLKSLVAAEIEYGGKHQ